MYQRQAARQDAQHREGAQPPRLRLHTVIQQIQAGEQKYPARQEGALGDEHVGDDVAPAQVVLRELGVVDRRLIPAIQDGAQPLQPGAGLQGVGAGDTQADPRHVKAIQKTQAAVDKQQQRGQRRRAPTPGQPQCQHQVAREHQRHHQRTRRHQRHLQAAAQQHEAGGQAVGQEWVA